jgi:uncharacterized membrane protein
MGALWVAAARGADAARAYLANALLFAMSFMLASTLLKIIALRSWSDIGFFAVIFCLRTLIKLTLKRDARGAAIPQPS